MAAYVFIFLILLFFHSLYKVLILPTIHLLFEHKLDQYLEQVSFLESKDNNQNHKVVFNEVRSYIQTSRFLLPFMSIRLIMRVLHNIESDNAMKKTLEHRKAMLFNCSNEELKNVNIQIGKVLKKAFYFNMSWTIVFHFVFTFIMFVLVKCFEMHKIFKKFKKSLNSKLDEINKGKEVISEVSLVDGQFQQELRRAALSFQ